MARALDADLSTPSVNENLGTTIKEQNKEREDTNTANTAIREGGVKIDPTTQTLDKSKLAGDYRDWKNYMTNFFENNTQRLIDNTVPVFSVEKGKVKIRGTREALDSPLAKSAKKALNSLVGADVNSDTFKKAIEELNTSMKDSVKNYIITEGYGFKDTQDYNNYLLAVQESRRPNPMNSTYYFITKDKNGNYVRKTFKEWIDYWRNNYSTDERVDLFTNSANAQYGYDRVPYILMSGGGDRSNAIYGFDPGEYLSLGLYNTGVQLTKLNHGIAQQLSYTLGGFNASKDALRNIGFDENTATNLVLNSPDISEEEFNTIKNKLDPHGPVLGGFDSLTPQEKAILIMGSKDAVMATVDDGVTGSNTLIDALRASDYNTYKDRSQNAHEINRRNEQMQAVNERIQKNMAVYGGQSLNFASNMLGVMTRQWEEALLLKALTGGAIDMNKIGEALGDAFADVMGFPTAEAAAKGVSAGGSILGQATARAVAQFVGGIPEDMIQDFVDSKLTNDPTLADDILTGENIISNIVYRLTFNALIKGTKNVIKNAINLKTVSDAARKAGVDIDADDVKRGVSGALDALNSGRKVYYADDGSLIFEDADGNLKNLSNVTLWSMQPLTEGDASNVLSDAAKQRLQGLIDQFKKEKELTVDKMQPVRDYFETGDWDYTIGKIGDDPDVTIPNKIKSTIVASALNYDGDYADAFSELKNNLQKYGFDYDNIYAKVDHTTLDAELKKFNDAFGLGIDPAGKTLPEVAKEIVSAILKAGRDYSDARVESALKDLLNDRFKDYVVTGKFRHGTSPIEGLFPVMMTNARLEDAIDIIAQDYEYGADNKVKSLYRLVEGATDETKLDTISLKHEIYDTIANIVAAYAPAFDEMMNKMSTDNVVSYTTDVISGISNIVEADPNNISAKAELNQLSSSLDNIYYQMEYNQHFTPIEEHVLGDIHSANELGVAFNKQKQALMDMAVNMSPSDFVFGKDPTSSALFKAISTKAGLDMGSLSFTLDEDGLGLLPSLYGKAPDGMKVSVMLMSPRDYIQIMKEYDSGFSTSKEFDIGLDESTMEIRARMNNGQKYPMPSLRFDENGALVDSNGIQSVIASQNNPVKWVPVAIEHPAETPIGNVIHTLYGGQFGFNGFMDITDDTAKYLSAKKNTKSPADGGVEDARSAFTQNELLEIWTESQYKDMTVEKMLRIMEDEFTTSSDSIDNAAWPSTTADKWATDYIGKGGADGDRKPINYWFDMSQRTQEWIDAQGRNGNPAAYKQEDGSYKISGRSALEIKVLQDKKLWAASLIKLRYDMGAMAHTQAGSVAELVRVKSASGLDPEEGVALERAYTRLYNYGISDEARNEFAASALGLRSRGVSPEMQNEMDLFAEQTKMKASESPAAFLEWMAEKYAMGKELYQLKEYSAASTMPMAKFLETPLTVGRVEKIWGPGRLVRFDSGNYRVPTMDLANETCLGFSFDITGVAIDRAASDPGSLTLKVRPIDMIGDLGSMFASEREVFIRKSLAYPAGNKVHSIFFDGSITTDADIIINDKNARMYQVDESLVINNHDYQKAKDAFRMFQVSNKEGWINDVNKFLKGEDGLTDFERAMNDVVDEDDVVRNKSVIIEALSDSVYGRQIAEAVLSDNPFEQRLVRSIYSKLQDGLHSANISNELSLLFNKPFVIYDKSYGYVSYTKGIVPELDNDIATNGGVHLNDMQAKRTANAQKVLEDWKAAADNESAEVKNTSFIENAGLNVDGNTVSFTSLVNNADAMARMANAKQVASNASDSATMKNRLAGKPSEAPDPIDWGKDKKYKFKSYADALAKRPSYRDAQYFDKWLPAAVEVGMREFNDWNEGVFKVAHPDVDMAQLVESWDFVNFLVHKDNTIAPNIDEIIGKTFIDSSGREVTVTQDIIDMYGEYDSFIKQQGARTAALQAQGIQRDYNQLGYLPHTDYNPLEQSAEEMMQGVLWRENTLKNSTKEDGTFTTEKLDNNLENRYRVWISNMSFDSLGDVAIFGEKMKELIADGVITVNKNSGTLKTKDGKSVRPQEAVAKAIQGDKNLNEQATKTKSAKDFNKVHTDINNKVDFKKLDQQIAEDMQKMGYSKALHDSYGDLYGNSTAKVLTQKNAFVSKITGLYDFMRSTTTTDGSLLNHGGEMLINPVGIANDIVRKYRQGGKLKELVTDLLVRKSGRSRKGAEYIYNKWLPDIQKHISADGTINSGELAAILTKHLRYEAWTGIKKWLARADYDSFNTATKKTLDNLLYRHNMIQQISNTPSVMKTINKAVNAIVGERHRALFYLNPKNALLQLSECIRLFTNFGLGDATKTLKRLVTDAEFRDTVAEWKTIVFPDRNPLKDVEPMADAWAKTAEASKMGADGTLTFKGMVKGGIETADAIALAPIDAAESMKNTTLLAGIIQEMETKKKNGTLKEPEYDYVMRRFQRVALANDEFGRLGYSDNPFARATLYLQNFTIRQLKMFGDNVVDKWGEGGAAKAFGYLAKALGWRTALFLAMAKLGYSAGQVLGYDPFDMLGNDYTGLDEEDMTELDKNMKSGPLSLLFVGGLTSLVQNYYFAARQAYERTNEATPADEAESIAQDTEDWGLKMPDVDWFELLYGWLPGGGAAKRTIQMSELMDKGVAVSQSGTKMYEAPSDLGNVLSGYLFGRNNTANARDYFQTPDPLQGLIDNGLGGFMQQMGRAFSTGFRDFDPIDRENYTDWFDGTAADEQQWQSGYYYFRKKAQDIFNAYNGQSSGYNSALDEAELKSRYREEMEKLGEELNRFSAAYAAKHGQIDGTKMQQLINILNDAQTNMMMDEETRNQESLAGLNRAQERYSTANLPAITRQTGPSTSSPETEYGTRFSPQFYNAVQGHYGAPAEAAKIVENLYKNKWKALRKQYSEKAYDKSNSFKSREKIQREYINLIRQDLDGIVSLYGSSIFTNDAVDDVMTDVFAGMIPYGDYNVNKKGRRVSLPSNVEVDVSDWLQQQYLGSNKNPRVSYDANAKELFDRMKNYLNNGNRSMARATARLLRTRVMNNRASLTRSELEEVQRILND